MAGLLATETAAAGCKGEPSPESLVSPNWASDLTFKVALRWKLYQAEDQLLFHADGWRSINYLINQSMNWHAKVPQSVNLVKSQENQKTVFDEVVVSLDCYTMT